MDDWKKHMESYYYLQSKIEWIKHAQKTAGHLIQCITVHACFNEPFSSGLMTYPSKPVLTNTTTSDLRSPLLSSWPEFSKRYPKHKVYSLRSSFLSNTLFNHPSDGSNSHSHPTMMSTNHNNNQYAMIILWVQ